MTKGLLVYRAFSFFEFVRMCIGRVATLIGMIAALLHFDENPIVISAFVLICLGLIVFIGDDQIIVYEKLVVQKTNSLATYFFNSNEAVIQLEDVEESFLDTSVPDAYASLVIQLLSFVSKKNLNSGAQPIFFKMKDGSVKQVLTSLEFSKRERIVEEINSLVNNSKSARQKKRLIKVKRKGN